MDWNTLSFDDSAWMVTKAANIPRSDSITTYIRKSFVLNGIEDYSVMNVRMEYVGGVVVYFNGYRVARFNLEETYDALTEPIEADTVTMFSQFHIILSAAGVQEGTNVIAFEIHQSMSSTSTDPVVFDATGVFGVEECSTVIDSYFNITSSDDITDPSWILDLDPHHYASVD